jgi:aminoglycoside phosphotransferase (APT) family kinase protein
MPDVYPVFQSYDLDLQRRCMELVRQRTNAPAPVCRYLETDTAWLGTPFLVMERIDGDAPADVPPYVFGGWVMDATPEQRDALVANSVEVLAQVHTITPTNADLTFITRPPRGSSAMDAQLVGQRNYYEWARDAVSYPLIERTFAWLTEHRPPEPDAVLNWGDSRIGNMMFHDFAPAAVLDWEMAALGPAEIDVGWMIFMHRFFEDLTRKYGMPCLPDFLQRERVAEIYAEESGREVDDLEWYEMFAAQRFAIVSIRTTMRTVAYGDAERPDDLDDVIMFRGLLEEMIERAESS